LDLDVFVVGIAMLFVAAAMMGSALLAAVGATRVAGADRNDASTSHVASALSSAGVGPVVTTGVRLAFDRRAPALPVRSTMLGIGAAIVVLAGSLTFDASLGRLIRSPQRWGYGWDLTLDATAPEADEMITSLAGDADLSAVSLLETNFTLVKREGRTAGMRAYGLRRPSAVLGYALRSGLQPVGPDEVVIGPELARAGHVSIGDVIDVATCPCGFDPTTATTSPVRVVGIALFPEDDAGNFNDALGFSELGFARHVGDAETSRVAVRVSGGRAVVDVAQRLEQRFPGHVSFFSYPIRPGEVESLRGLRPFPPVLAVVAGLLGLAALANMLLTTQQRRRRELATLRGLGFTPRSIRRCGLWQSIGVTLVAATPAIVVGVLTGAAVWLAATRRIGVATDASTPVAWLVFGVLCAFVIASCLGLLTAARHARAPVAASLHDE
jgi:hypothetical protein